MLTASTIFLFYFPVPDMYVNPSERFQQLFSNPTTGSLAGKRGHPPIVGRGASTRQDEPALIPQRTSETLVFT